MKRISLLLISFSFSLSLTSQTTFQKLCSLQSLSEYYCGDSTNDGGFILGGYYLNSVDEMCLVKLDSMANVLWAKSYFTGNGSTYCNFVQQTFDGGYIMVGGGLLIKTNSNGYITWSKNYSLAIKSARQTLDGGYIIVTNSIGGSNIILIKADQNGNIIWSKNYGGLGNITSWGNKIEQTADSGFIVLGSTRTSVSGSQDIYLIKTDSVGNKIWSKIYGVVGDDMPTSIKQTSDGGYILTGETYINGTAYTDIFLLKTDINGNINWLKTYGGAKDEGAHFVCQTSNGEYIVTGNTFSFDISNQNWFCIKTNNTGNVLSSRIYHYGYWANGLAAFKAMDGGFKILGSVRSGAIPGAYVIRTDSLGNSNCGDTIVAITVNNATFITSIPNDTVTTANITANSPSISTNILTSTVYTLCYTGIDELLNNDSFSLSPNPFTSSTTISFSENELHTLYIRDVLGRELNKITFTGKQYVLEKGTIQPGIYFISIKDADKQLMNRKIVVQ